MIQLLLITGIGFIIGLCLCGAYFMIKSNSKVLSAPKSIKIYNKKDTGFELKSTKTADSDSDSDVNTFEIIESESKNSTNVYNELKHKTNVEPLQTENKILIEEKSTFINTDTADIITEESDQLSNNGMEDINPPTLNNFINLEEDNSDFTVNIEDINKYYEPEPEPEPEQEQEQYQEVDEPENYFSADDWQ